MLNTTSRLNVTRTLGSTVMLGAMLFLSVRGYAADTIIDNKDPGASWTNVPAGWNGKELTSAYNDHTLVTSGKDAKGTFTFSSLQSDKFDVYMYWPVYSGSTPDDAAPVVIKHSSGTQTVTVNQRKNGGKWNLLGTWTLDKTAYLTLTNRGSGKTYFDAVKLVPLSEPLPPDPTLSMTGDPLTVSTGGATTLSWGSQNATSCTASGGWSGDKGLSGSETVNNITSNQTYTLTCSGTTKSVSAAVNVVVTLPPPPVAPFVVGLNVQQHSGHFDAAGQGFTTELGAHSIRVSYDHGDYDFGVNWAAENGKGVAFMLGYGAGCDAKTESGRQCYADRSADLVQQYGDKVQYWEVWNEWNGEYGPYGDYPENKSRFVEYTDLLCRTYDAIKAVQPSAIVVGGVLSGANEDFLTGMLDNGAGDCMDMLSLHLYVYRQDWPGHVPSDAPASDGVDKFIEVMNERNDLVIQKTGRSIPILVTEAGRNEGKLNNQTDDEQLTADYITELYSRAPTLAFLEGIWWFELEDTSERSFGLLRSNNTKKPSFAAFQAAAE